MTNQNQFVSIDGIRVESSKPLVCVRLLKQLHDLQPGHIFTTTQEQAQILIRLGKAEPATKQSMPERPKD